MANFLTTEGRGLRISSIDYFSIGIETNGPIKTNVVLFFLSGREKPQRIETESELSSGDVVEALSYAVGANRQYMSFSDAIGYIVKNRKSSETNGKSINESLKSL